VRRGRETYRGGKGVRMVGAWGGSRRERGKKGLTIEQMKGGGVAVGAVEDGGRQPERGGL